MKYFVFSLFTCSVLLGCTNQGVNRGDINQVVEVIYAEVLKTKPIRFDSKADEAAVTGAIEGAIENSDGNSDDILGGALASAIASALFVTIEEGSRDGLLVDLRGSDDSNFNIVTKETDILVGECLQLIKGEEVSVLHVEHRFCKPQEGSAK